MFGMVLSIAAARPHRRIRIGRALAGGIAGLFILCAGCTALGPGERESLTQASAQYSRGDVSGAVVRLDRLIRDFEKAPEIAEAYYVRGLCRMKMGQVGPAMADFREVIDRSGREGLVAMARTSLASIAYQGGEWGNAADLYEQSVNHLPDKPPTDQILYNAGVAMQRAGRWKQASFQFARILHKFPDRPIASEASKMAAWRHEYFAIQLGVYANADSAAAAVIAFRNKRLDAVQENLPRGGGAMWVVMSGRYAIYSDALAAMPRTKQICSSAFVIP
jgi:outer membrane protein assembly factor BamD (BamD/ComL family)